MSRFLSSFEADPEEQRFNKAAIHLRALVFGRMSDDHVVALALLHELSGLYRRAYGTDQVLQNPSAQGGSQETALGEHLRALGLPRDIAELEPCEVSSLLGSWEGRWQALPRPFDKTLEAFVLHAKTLSTDRAQPSVPSYQAQ